MSEFFRFEDDSRDFPYYRHNPRISKKAWIILLLLIPVSFLAYGTIAIDSEFTGSLVFCLILLVPVLYFSNWDYSLMFRKPTKKEIRLAVLLFIGYLIYAIAIGTVLDFFSQTSEVTSEYLGINLEALVSLVFSMMGEELAKFIPLMFFMRLFYKLTENRKASIVISSLIIMIYFGMLHYDPPVTPLLSALLTQGVGTIFELYGYIKTKNLFVPYMSHLITDAFIFTLSLMGL